MSWVFFKAPTVAIGITSSWHELLLESNPFKPALLRSRNVPNRNPLVRSALIPLGTWKAVMMKPHVPCRASISKNDKYVIKKLDYIDILQHFSISDSGTFAFGESHISWTPWFSNDEKKRWTTKRISRFGASAFTARRAARVAAFTKWRHFLENTIQLIKKTFWVKLSSFFNGKKKASAVTALGAMDFNSEALATSRVVEGGQIISWPIVVSPKTIGHVICREVFLFAKCLFP